MNTVYDLIQYSFKIKKREESSQIRILNSAKPLLDADYTTFTVDDAREFRENPPYQHCDGSLRQDIANLEALWKLAKHMGKLEVNVWEGLKFGLKPSKRRYKTRRFEEFERLHDCPFFLGIWAHGMRLEELGGLESKDIHIETDIPYIDLYHTEARRLKNDASIREVPIHPSWLPYAKKWKMERSSKAEQHRIARYCKGNYHALRHYFRARMMRAKIEFTIQQALMGHSANSMTQHYGLIELEDKWEAMQEIPL